MQILDDLRHRKLVQWALAYPAGAWVLLQVLDLLAENFHWPEAIERIAAVLVGVGFLTALVLAWYHGEKGQQRVSGPELDMKVGRSSSRRGAEGYVAGTPSTYWCSGWRSGRRIIRAKGLSNGAGLLVFS